MKQIFIIILLFTILVSCTPAKQTNPQYQVNLNLNKTNMKLTSSAFKQGESIPAKYTCDGNNTNPPLQISNIPEQSKSLVLIVDDPDAPAGTWVHWLLWNIDPQIKEIPANSVPDKAILGTTSFKRPEYGGPCPPSGQHRYFFKLYALDSQLELPAGSTVKDLEQAMQNKIIDSSQLIGLYSRH